MILITTGEDLGREYIIGDVIFSSVVKAKNMFQDIGAGFKNMFGGKSTSYTNLLHEVLAEAKQGLIAIAQQQGADAIIAFRFMSTEIGQGYAELTAYGTTVKFR